MMDPLNIKDVRAARIRIADRIKIYARKGYDARPMLPEFWRLTKMLVQLGGTPSPENEVYTKEYWEKPASIRRQQFNKNPIIGAKDGNPIWKFPLSKAPRIKTINEKVITKEQIGDPVINNKRTRSTNISEKGHYIINVSWTDAGVGPDIIEKVRRFFAELGLKPNEENFETGWGTEHTTSYKFEGTDDGFKMLTRSVTVMLDIISNNNTDIGVHGHKL